MVFIFLDFYFPIYWPSSFGLEPIDRKIKISKNKCHHAPLIFVILGASIFCKCQILAIVWYVVAERILKKYSQREVTVFRFCILQKRFCISLWDNKDLTRKKIKITSKIHTESRHPNVSRNEYSYGIICFGSPKIMVPYEHNLHPTTPFFRLISVQ